MRHLLLKFFLISFIFCLFSCSGNEHKGENNSAESATIIVNNTDSCLSENRVVITPAQLLDVDSVNAALLAQGYSKQEIDKRFKNERLLLSHLIINEDSMSYRLDLSEQEALRLGVDKEFYDAMIKNVKFLNDNIREMLEIGSQVHIEDYKDVFKDYNE